MVKNKIISLALCGILTFGVCTPASAAELPTDPVVAVEATTEAEVDATTEAAETEEVVPGTTEATVTEEVTTEAVTEEVVTEEEVVEEATASDADLAEDTEEVTDANGFTWKGNYISGYSGKGGAVTIPSRCVGIEVKVFEGNTKITSLTYNGSGTIGSMAFRNCTNLQTVVLGNSLENLYNNAFEGCTKLKTVTIGSGVEDIYHDVFRNCTALTTVKINTNKISFLNSSVFQGCRSLTSINLPSCITKIPWSMFEGCTSLKSINLSNVTEIGSDAFADCSSLTSVTFGKNLTKIAGGAFENTALASISLPANLREIGSTAFKNTRLKSVTLPANVTKIETSAFAENAYLTSFTAGSKLTEIGSSAFRKCTSLKTVNLNSGLSIIDYSAFTGCVSLTTINIPETVKTLGSFAFSDCVNLTSMRLGNAIASIGGFAFDGCTSLKTLYMPYGVKEIGSYAVNDAKNVTVYVYKGTYGETWAKENNVNYKTMTFAPNPVQKLKAVSAGKNKVKLTWQKTAYTDGYLIYALKNNEYGYVGSTTYTTYTDTKALSGGYNFYYVYAYKKGSNGNKIIGKAPAYVYAKGVCAAVTNLKAAGVKGGVKVTFKKSADAAGYYVYKKTGNGKFTYIGYTTSNTYTDKKASKTQYSFYRVVPYHKNGSKKVMGQLGTYVYAKAK